MGMEAMHHRPSKSSLRSGHPSSPKKRLSFATFINYPARKGYSYNPTRIDVQTIREAGYVVGSHEAGSLSPPLSTSASPESSSASPLIQFGSIPSSPDRITSVGGNSGSSGTFKFVGPDFGESSPLAQASPVTPPRQMGSLLRPIVLSDDETDASPLDFLESPSLQNITKGLQSFDDMIEDMAASYWDCQNCLGMGHMSDTCTNRIRCRLCFRSGHVKKDCPRLNSGSTICVPKVSSTSF